MKRRDSRRTGSKTAIQKHITISHQCHCTTFKVEQSSANQNPRSRPVHSYAPYLKTLHRTGEHGHRPRSRGASRRHPLHPSASHPRHAGRPASASRLHPAPRHQREPGQLLLRLHAGELGAVRAVTADP
ncbi:UBAP1-MVB12-associated (UMA)-domain containing protein 1 isoform X2 [Pangasianodon hypophthalmus]|uniref:UBAP1-MVB12-associated (UMA)-domain containing protein 1 isoform X2 n=1 Tax=Pangasianodon hypophthalmus TaxID=310915 RepID=UPI0023082675|nr:UBAP1-MVB12-associated (UMA)-domain containing protein 1 isoform X2 [Pangasianodon hypophthalmus]